MYTDELWLWNYNLFVLRSFKKNLFDHFRHFGWIWWGSLVGPRLPHLLGTPISLGWEELTPALLSAGWAVAWSVMLVPPVGPWFMARWWWWAARHRLGGALRWVGPHAEHTDTAVRLFSCRAGARSLCRCAPLVSGAAVLPANVC